jgi:hypothetical protein
MNQVGERASTRSENGFTGHKSVTLAMAFRVERPSDLNLKHSNAWSFGSNSSNNPHAGSLFLDTIPLGTKT